MRSPGPTALALILAGVAVGASGRCETGCAARVVVDDGVPARMAARLRARLRALETGGDRCGALRFCWENERLVIEVALRDGRVARRALASLDDALPTAVAVLATAPDEPEAAAPPPPEPEAPVVLLEPVATEAVPVEAVVAPILASEVAPVESPLRVRVGGALGVGWLAGRALFAQRGEVELRYRRLVLGVRGEWAAGEEGNEELRAQSYGLAGRWLAPIGRWEVEFGAVITASSLRAETEHHATDRRSVWSLRVGVDAGAALRLTRALSAFVRVEGLATAARLSDGPDPDDPSPFSVSSTAGLRLEVAP